MLIMTIRNGPDPLKPEVLQYLEKPFQEIPTQSRLHGAVVRAVKQGYGDPCVPGLNPTVGHGCQSFG
jgi:hypothetical protein